jgi:hypothetical protein
MVTGINFIHERSSEHEIGRQRNQRSSVPDGMGTFLEEYSLVRARTCLAVVLRARALAVVSAPRAIYHRGHRDHHDNQPCGADRMALGSSAPRT